MNDFILSCCSTADLTEEHFNSSNISYICFHYELNGKEYEDDLGKSVPFDQFYLALQNGASAKTSQVNADEFEHYFESFLKEGKDILHVTLSSGISGVINSAMIAKETLEDRYPERKIYIVDSLGASSGYGLFMNRLADLRDNGYTLEQLYDWAMQHRLNLHHWFFSTDLTFYIKGGRISKTAGTIGGLLGICPLLNMNDEGKLIPRQKIRTKKKLSVRLLTKWKNLRIMVWNTMENVIFRSLPVWTMPELLQISWRHVPNLNGKVEIHSIGTAIGSHTGPGTVALFFWGSTRTH